MALKSMTGFARSEGSDEAAHWHWELRCVNGRGLDLRLRLPVGFEQLETQIRQLAANRFTRGNVTLNLRIKKLHGDNKLQVNDAMLEQVLLALQVVEARTDLAPANAADLLAIKGMLEIVEIEEDAQVQTARQAGVMASLEAAMEAIVTDRLAEGARMQTVIEQQLDTIKRLLLAVEKAPARRTDVIKDRLAEQLRKLVDAVGGVDDARLYQEAAILATRADVEEELKRLSAHIQAAHDLLALDEAVGRRLDFLAQEFNREANTLCSKSNDPEITKSGLELKAVIDQMREQVQNIE